MRKPVLLVRQYRHGTDRSYWALPGGYINERETPGEAAQRELLEETGYAARSVCPIAALHPVPACLHSPATSCFARIFAGTPRSARRGDRS